MPGISHRGWNGRAGLVPGLRGLPHCGQCPAPLFSPFHSPHPLPGLAQGQTGEGSSCRGFPELPWGRWKPPLPSSFHPSSLIPSCLLLFPSSMFPSSLLLSFTLLSPPSWKGREAWRVEQPLLCAGMCGKLEGRRAGSVGLLQSRAAGQVLAEFKSPYIEPSNLASWSWKGLPDLAPSRGIMLHRRVRA